MTAREVIQRLRRQGWTERQGKGSHVIFTKQGHRNITVSSHGGDLPMGTLRAIARDAGWEWPPRT
jgi:predicted RNA binding protein YcfA (HicA-like mRNA interferase family)